MRTLFLLVALVAFGPLAATADAQSSMDDVHLFNSSFAYWTFGPSARDVATTSSPYVSATGNYLDADNASFMELALTGGLPIRDVAEIGALARFESIDPEAGDGESGIGDPLAYGRFNVMNDRDTKLAVGGLVTLPLGSEDIGEGDGVHFGFFGAARHYLDQDLGLTGTVGIDLIEIGDDRETNLVIGGGAIFRASDKFHLVPEFQFQTETDYAAFSGGVDYAISPSGRLRGALLVGIDDGAPDFGLQAGVLFNFGR